MSDTARKQQEEAQRRAEAEEAGASQGTARGGGKPARTAETELGKFVFTPQLFTIAVARLFLSCVPQAAPHFRDADDVISASEDLVMKWLAAFLDSVDGEVRDGWYEDCEAYLEEPG